MILTLLVLAGVLSGALYLRLRRHEEQKAEQRLRSLRAAVELTHVLDLQAGRSWPPQHKTPWKDRRVS